MIKKKICTFLGVGGSPHSTGEGQSLNEKTEKLENEGVGGDVKIKGPSN